MNAETPNIDFAAVARAALSQHADLLSRWFPAGKKVGREYLVGDLSGTPGESLSINTTNGRWSDFAAGSAGGDLVSLYAAIHQLAQSEAARRLAHELGVPMDERVSRVAPPAAEKVEEWTPILPVPADAPPPPTAHPSHGKPTHVAHYRDRDGMLLGLIYRCEPAGKRKQIPTLTFCEHLDGRREWQWKSLPKPRSLYGMEFMREGDETPIIVVEGEPKADAARRMVGNEAIVIAWPGGSQAVAHADWQMLTGRKVILWPDADEPGIQAAAKIKRILRNASIDARAIVPPVGVAEGWDLADAERDGWSGKQVLDHAGLTGALLGDPLVRRSANLPPIRMVSGDHDLIVTAAENALIASRMPIFRRDKELVRPVSQKVPASGGRMTIAAGLDQITTPAMIDLLCQAVEWEKFDKREKCWRSINPPTDVAAGVLSRAALSKMPSISGVITTPTMRPDGSILLEGGYDQATRLYHVVDNSLRLPPIPERPTRAQAFKALQDLQDLLTGFPFVIETMPDGSHRKVSRSVALSAIITAVVRGALSVAPMHAFRANTAGSGKSYLVDLVSLIATGRPCPVMAVADKEDETEKRLVGLLLAGYPIISLDNVNGELGGDLLCQAIERPIVRVRELGSSNITEIEARATLLATGNGLRVRGDMTRRTLIGSLDAGVERPELRVFDTNPVVDVLADRGRYVAAALLIIRAYQVAGRPNPLPTIASFEDWSRSVRESLVWLGCDDPAASMEVAREDDPELSELREMLSAWAKELRIGEAYTVKQLDLAAFEQLDTGMGRSQDELQCPLLNDVIIKIAGDRGKVNPKKLGTWLANRNGRIADGKRIEKAGTAQGGLVKWRLVNV